MSADLYKKGPEPSGTRYQQQYDNNDVYNQDYEDFGDDDFGNDRELAEDAYNQIAGNRSYGSGSTGAHTNEAKDSQGDALSDTVEDWDDEGGEEAFMKMVQKKDVKAHGGKNEV
jgi:hypothetical protein